MSSFLSIFEIWSSYATVVAKPVTLEMDTWTIYKGTRVVPRTLVRRFVCLGAHDGWQSSSMEDSSGQGPHKQKVFKPEFGQWNAISGAKQWSFDRVRPRALAGSKLTMVGHSSKSEECRLCNAEAQAADTREFICCANILPFTVWLVWWYATMLDPRHFIKLPYPVFQ